MRHRLVSAPQRPYCRQIALTHRWPNDRQLLASIASAVRCRVWLVTTKLHRLKPWVVFDSSVNHTIQSALMALACSDSCTFSTRCSNRRKLYCARPLFHGGYLPPAAHLRRHRAGDCSASLISIVSDVVCDSGGRTMAWEADGLLYLETSAVIQ